MTKNTDSQISAELCSGKLNDIKWMCGPWRGELGPQRVQEHWSDPESGTMSTMVRLLSGDTTDMIELICITEQENTLVLHLRQFSPELALRTSQTMRLAEIGDQTVAFVCDHPDEPREPDALASIPRLEYRAIHSESDQKNAPETMEVHVSVANPAAPDQPIVVTAQLHRPLASA